MDVQESRRSNRDSDSRSDLMSLALGIVDVGLRGLRVTLGRAVPGEELLDVALGAAVVGAENVSRAAQSVRLPFGPWAVGSLGGELLPSVPPDWPPLRLLEELRRRGHRERLGDRAVIDETLDALVPLVVDEVVRRIDINSLVREYVDVEAIVAGLDLDSMVDAVDVDRIAQRLDLDAIIERLDLTAIVRDRVDLDSIVQAVDVDAVAARLDLDAIIERLALPVLTQRVIDEIDLPGVIRESSGSMASEAVRGVRMHSIEADEAVAHALDRILRHRSGSSAPGTGSTS